MRQAFAIQLSRGYAAGYPTVPLPPGCIGLSPDISCAVRYLSHHAARQRLQHSCTGSCWLSPRAWAMKEIPLLKHGLFPLRRPVLTYHLATFFLRHPQSLEVRAWEHKPIKQRNIAHYVVYYAATFVYWITWVVSVVLPCSCSFEPCTYAATYF